jgi:hypothetical protein
MSVPYIYTYRKDGIFAMTEMHFDDLPLACNNTLWVVEFKRIMGQRFEVKDLRELQLLGMHTTRHRVARTLSIDQSQYITDMLDKHGMGICSPYAMPMDPSFPSGIASATLTPLSGPVLDVYPSLLCNMQYAATCSRP